MSDVVISMAGGNTLFNLMLLHISLEVPTEFSKQKIQKHYCITELWLSQSSNIA